MSKIDDLVRQSVEAVKRMTPQEREAMLEAQRQSWVRAFTSKCEHGLLDWEQCPECRSSARLAPEPEGKEHDFCSSTEISV